MRHPELLWSWIQNVVAAIVTLKVVKSYGRFPTLWVSWGTAEGVSRPFWRAARWPILWRTRFVGHEVVDQELDKRFGNTGSTSRRSRARSPGDANAPVLRIESYIDAKSETDKAIRELRNAFTSYGYIPISAKFGLRGDPAQMQADVASLILQYGNYFDKFKASFNINFQMTFGDTDNPLELDFLETVNSYVEGKRQEIERIGREMKDLLAEGFKDGEWIPDKQAEFLRLHEEIQEVTRQVVAYEELKDLTTLKLKYGTGTLDAETTKLFMEELMGKLTELRDRNTGGGRNARRVGTGGGQIHPGRKEATRTTN